MADYKSLVEECFPEVFRGLGNLRDPRVCHQAYTICCAACHLHTENSGFACETQSTRRAKPNGVHWCYVSRVEEPTQWCAWMVAIPKKNGKLCICVHLKQLNEAVHRKVQPVMKLMKHLLSFQVLPFLVLCY